MADDKNKEKTEEKVGVIKRYWIIILILFLIAGWFYWFQWRPAEIRKSCHQRIVDRPGDIRLTFSFNKFGITEYESLYEVCLHEMGLK